MTIILPVNVKEDMTVEIVNYRIYKVSVTAALHRCHGFESHCGPNFFLAGGRGGGWLGGWGA